MGVKKQESKSCNKCISKYASRYDEPCVSCEYNEAWKDDDKTIRVLRRRSNFSQDVSSGKSRW